MRIRAVAVCLAVFLAPAVRPSSSQAGGGPGPGDTVVHIQLAPDRTRITFTLAAFLHTVHGHIALSRGAIDFDPTTGAAQGDVEIAAASAATGNRDRDQTMRTQVLETQRFPDITFRPRRVIGRVAPSGSSIVTLEGTLRLHGNDHPVRLPTQVQVDGTTFTADTHIKVPYVAWGLKNPSNFFLRVAKTVTVTIHAAGTMHWPPAA